MSVFSISDLHLSGSVPKSMEIFGRRWTGYAEKIEKRWRSVVTERDTVILPGDISWAMNFKELKTDFLFLESLPGKKLLGKGNHDFWWTTVTKMRRFCEEIGVQSIDFLHNNAYAVENGIICGTRGWFIEEKMQNTVNTAEYTKIVAREQLRLEHCIAEAEKLRGDQDKEILVYLHFPPVFGNFVCEEFVDTLVSHGIKRCFYGHIHGNYLLPATIVHRGVEFTLIAADFLNFVPLFTPI